ncbi:hypothetical protein KDA_32550 [Dictyobacter alpinus]|uniref:FHA domain-containing protein n=1 Tax=Dictyobacter alpinus TaxID=2014873 RepID=A0A402B8S2_9CHLR|nr:DUF3662 and FHA domain-containing protein [Dictyobacter alpinus]GCE27771.1 hypothetical protein KDA_32550 [Dictyobacter alpinus]
MNARQNPFAKLEAFMQRMIEGPFNRLFPSKMEPIEVARKLERAMDDNTMLQGEGRRLSPNVYDIYLSINDHQQMAPGQAALIRDWQNHLVEFARRRHYTLKTVPIIRLHSDTSLRAGSVRIETEQADPRNNGSGEGLMSTQALSAEQLAQIRAQLAPNQQLPGIGGNSSPNQNMQGSHSGANQYSGHGHQGNSGVVPTIPPTQQAPAMPQAWLTIRLPQAGQQTYRIEKPLVNIGRQLSNDIIVEDKRVSRYHAQIKYQPDGQFGIYDLGSTNGITINNTPHMRQHTLRNGDQFTIGSYDFYFERR